MSARRIALLGLAQATGTVLYVALVVLLLTFVTGPGGPDGEGQPAESLMAVAFLVLFIVSACISATLVLGYPAMLALRQRIRDAAMLVAATLAWLGVMAAVVIVASVYVPN